MGIKIGKVEDFKAGDILEYTNSISNISIIVKIIELNIRHNNSNFYSGIVIASTDFGGFPVGEKADWTLDVSSFKGWEFKKII